MLSLRFVTLNATATWIPFIIPLLWWIQQYNGALLYFSATYVTVLLNMTNRKLADADFAICHVERRGNVNSIQNPSTVTNSTMELCCILLPLTLPYRSTWQIANLLTLSLRFVTLNAAATWIQNPSTVTYSTTSQIANSLCAFHLIFITFLSLCPLMIRSIVNGYAPILSWWRSEEHPLMIKVHCQHFFLLMMKISSEEHPLQMCTHRLPSMKTS